jgi:hypothetical protein
MPITILVSILLFCVATLYGILQVVYAWTSVPHNQPAIAYGWALALTAVYIPMILAAIVAGLTLRAGRFFRLTVVSSGVASLLFPFGTAAAIFTLAVARRQFPRWYKRAPRAMQNVTR